MSAVTDTSQGLRLLAVAARGEAWEYELVCEQDDSGFEYTQHAVRETMGRWGSSEVGTIHHETDARFIAAANPAVVLRLLDDLDLMRERLSPPLFAEYSASKEQIEAQRAANVALEAENDELAQENSRLLGLMASLVRSYEGCAAFLEKARRGGEEAQ